MRGLFAVLLAGACLGACSVWPVNQDPKGMDYRREANRVIIALQSYHRDRGTFPADLNGLVPAYLPALPDEPTLNYRSSDGSIAFHYIPSWPQLRPVWCNSVGNSTDWRCAEHLI